MLFFPPLHTGVNEPINSEWENISACYNLRCFVSCILQRGCGILWQESLRSGFGVILIISISSLELLVPLQHLRQFDNDAKWIIFINEVHTAVHHQNNYTDVMHSEWFSHYWYSKQGWKFSVLMNCENYTELYSLMRIKSIKRTYRGTDDRHTDISLYMLSFILHLSYSSLQRWLVCLCVTLHTSLLNDWL